MRDFPEDSARRAGDNPQLPEHYRALSPQVEAAARSHNTTSLAESNSYNAPAYYAEESRENLAEYLVVLRRRWRIILGCMAVVVLAVGLLTFLSKPTYRATSKLIFADNPGRMQMLSQMGISGMHGTRLGTQVELISGKETAKQAALLLEKEEGLRISPEEIQSSLRAGVMEGTDIVKVDSYHSDPNFAQKIANAVSQAFVNWNEERMKKGGKETAEYISRQLEVARSELLSSENALRSFKENRNVISLSEETESRLAHIAKLEADAAATYANLREVTKRLGRARQELSRQNEILAAGGSIRDNSLVQDLRSKLVGLEEQLAEARQRYTERYPGVISDLEARVEDTRKRLNQEVEAIISGKAGALGSQQAALEELSRLETEEIALRARQSALQGLTAVEKSVLEKVPAEELELARLKRAAETAAKIYTGLLERSQEAKINQVMEVGNVEIGEEAALPTVPIRPHKTLNLAFGLLCGALLGLAAAFLLEYMDDTVKDASEATQLAQSPLLGIIPRTTGENQVTAMVQPRSPATEAYRTLRSNVVFTGINESGSSVLVTSPGAGEGKSSTAANLAVTMAHTGKRVILVDTDLRLPVLHKLFKLSGGPGLTDVILGNCSVEEALHPTDIEGLSILPCGALPPNPADLLDSRRMSELAEELKTRADVVFFDSPPLVLVTDAMLLSTYCDRVLLICSSGETTRQDMIRARQLLEQARALVGGVVFNKIENRRYGRAYDSYYYRYCQEQGKRGRKRRRSAPQRSLPMEQKTEESQPLSGKQEGL